MYKLLLVAEIENALLSSINLVSFYDPNVFTFKISPYNLFIDIFALSFLVLFTINFRESSASVKIIPTRFVQVFNQLLLVKHNFQASTWLISAGYDYQYCLIPRSSH